MSRMGKWFIGLAFAASIATIIFIRVRHASHHEFKDSIDSDRTSPTSKNPQAKFNLQSGAYSGEGVITDLERDSPTDIIQKIYNLAKNDQSASIEILIAAFQTPFVRADGYSGMIKLAILDALTGNISPKVIKFASEELAGGAADNLIVNDRLLNILAFRIADAHSVLSAFAERLERQTHSASDPENTALLIAQKTRVEAMLKKEQP